MSGCTRSLDYLLEAELGELSGEDDTEIGRHVRGCMRCRKVGQKMLGSTASLDTALATVPGGFDVDALLKRASVSAGVAQTAEVTPLRRRWKQFAAAALAASIVGLLVLNDWDEALPGTAFTPRVGAELPIVEPFGEQNVAVITTDNPDITVLWFF